MHNTPPHRQAATHVANPPNKLHPTNALQTRTIAPGAKPHDLKTGRNNPNGHSIRSARISRKGRNNLRPCVRIPNNVLRCDHPTNPHLHDPYSIDQHVPPDGTMLPEHLRSDK